MIELTQEDLAAYQDQGYWISPVLFNEEGVSRLRVELKRMFDGEIDGDGWYFDSDKRRDISDDPTSILRITNGWWINDEVHRVVTDPRIGTVAAALMNTDEVRLWHDQVIMKPGTNGQTSHAGNVGWHQDYAYWPASNTSNMCTAWIALQDTDLTNGGMRTLVGSHKLGLLEDANTFFEQDLDALKERFEERVGDAWNDEPCILKAGQISFHHSLCFHGSGPNLTDQTRFSIVSHYMPKGAAYDANAVRHRNMKYLGPRPKHGQLFDNEYFPLVHP